MHIFFVYHPLSSSPLLRGEASIIGGSDPSKLSGPVIRGKEAVSPVCPNQLRLSAQSYNFVNIIILICFCETNDFS